MISAIDNMPIKRQGFSPFVCKKMPFVFIKNTGTKPLVCKKIPYIENHKKSLGFTIVELLVTMVVVGILGAIAVPSVSTMMKNQRVSSYANDFIADFNFARSEAIKRGGTNIVLCARGTGGGINNCDAAAQYTNGWLLFVDSNNNNSIDAAETLLREKPALTNGVTLKSFAIATVNCPGGSSAGPRFVLSSGGTITTGTGCYAMCDTRGAAFGRELVVGVSGQIRAVAPASSCP